MGLVVKNETNEKMRLLTLGLIICQITVPSEAEKYGAHFPPRGRNHGRQILQHPEPRYRSEHPDYPPNYNERYTRKDYDLPVTFKAPPPYEDHDYWKRDHDYANRRTFFGDFHPDAHGKPFQGLYQFMTSIFTGRDEITSEYPDAYHYNRNRAAPPYVTPVTNSPYRYTPTEPNYIPPPKPIRASVIKLETITRSPIYSSFEYETTPRYYPPVKAILNQVLIENSKANVTWYPEEPLPEIIPPFKPLPVLPKPDYIPPTTLKPAFGGFYSDQSQPFEYYNKTDYKYPESVQDQLPHLSVGEVRIPYVSEKSIPQIFDSPTTETPPVDYFPSTHNFDIPNIGVNRRDRPIHFEAVTTTVKSFPGAVEKVKRPTFKFTKKLTAQLDRNPVERVTNLTVLGYSKPENVTPYKQVNYVNVRDVINYEMGKLDSTVVSSNSSSTRAVNLNDELSLDAKILKDTNWDGLPEVEATTTEIPKETTTIQPPKSKAFWEIPEGVNTDPPDVPTTTTEQTRHQTTTELFWLSTTETSEPTTTVATTSRIIPRKAERRLEILDGIKPTGEAEVTIPSDGATLRRRYSRRPKVVNFTPYPTGEELQKKVASRTYFPKRQKPNITLTFGNKNVLQKMSQVFGKDEVMKFSDEDLRKRRKLEKRRRVYKRVRVSTSERPVPNDSS